MIKNLVFDFGKVLVDYDFDVFFKTVYPDAKRRQAIASILNSKEIQPILDKEDVPFDIFWEGKMKEFPDFAEEIRYFKDHYPDIISNEVPGMRELLIKLKAEGFKLYGLSNWCSKIYITMNQYDIFKLLDGRIISSEEKEIKPYPTIYRRLFEKYNLKPEECIFTDDRADNIETSKSLGMDGIVFNDVVQYEKELREILKRSNS